jgi:hypothetical protein
VRSYTLRMQQGMVNCYPAMIGGSRDPISASKLLERGAFTEAVWRAVPQESRVYSRMVWLVALVLSRFLFQSRPEEYCVILNRT